MLTDYMLHKWNVMSSNTCKPGLHEHCVILCHSVNKSKFSVSLLGQQGGGVKYGANEHICHILCDKQSSQAIFRI